MPLPLLLFDCDGTLVDSAPDLTATLNHILTKHGRTTIDISVVRHMVGEGVTNALVTFLRDGQEGTSEKTAAILVAARDEVSTTLSKLESEYDMFCRSGRQKPRILS